MKLGLLVTAGVALAATPASALSIDAFKDKPRPYVQLTLGGIPEGTREVTCALGDAFGRVVAYGSDPNPTAGKHQLVFFHRSGETVYRVTCWLENDRANSVSVNIRDLHMDDIGGGR